MNETWRQARLAESILPLSRKLLTLALLPSWSCYAEAPRPPATPDALSVADFGATPNDRRNDDDALRAAIEACRQRRSDTLVVPPGRYDLRDEDAVRLMNEVMSGLSSTT